MASPPSNINDLTIFYFINQNIVFSTDIDVNPIPDVERLLLLEILRKHFNITEVEEYLKQNPGLLRALARALQKDQELVTRITNSVMSHPQWFLNEGDDHLQSYLAHVKEADSGLYRRIIELLSESPDCCVCMESKTDTVFQCGHGTCSTCSGIILASLSEEKTIF